VRFKVVLEPCEEGGYTVYVPSLPGCISEGDTVEESLKNIKEAIELHLESVDSVELEFCLKNLLDQITKNNLHGEFDTGNSVGKEFW